MEKNIKDYLHLYVGCDCQYAVFMLGTSPHYWQKKIDAGVLKCVLNDEAIAKPILRPIADITNDEAEEIGYDNAKIFLSANSDYLDNIGVLRPESFIYLLSKGFDLFGLIEAGIAIDKTEITQQ